jgi:hypothetical protein
MPKSLGTVEYAYILSIGVTPNVSMHDGLFATRLTIDYELFSAKKSLLGNISKDLLSEARESMFTSQEVCAWFYSVFADFDAANRLELAGYNQGERLEE